jgi:hypothetical protein
MKTIVWDVDDVLNDLMRVWFERAWLPAHRSCTLSYGQLAANPPHEILGVSLKEYQESLDAFRRTEPGRLEPVPEVLAWFHTHGCGFRHIALSSVPLCATEVSAAWVLKHFGCWIRSFNVVPSRREGDGAIDYDQDKADFLRWWGRADIFIDDNRFNVEAACALGIESVLMPRPWNESRKSLRGTLSYLAGLA